MPCSASRALIRLICPVRSLTSRRRSRCVRLLSSSSRFGTRTILQTLLSPRQYAISARSNASTSIASVLTMQPEALITGFMTGDRLDRPAKRRRFFPAELGDYPEKGLDLTASAPVTSRPTIRGPIARDQPLPLAHIDGHKHAP